MRSAHYIFETVSKQLSVSCLHKNPEKIFELLCPFLEIDNPEECLNKLYNSLVTIADEIVPRKDYRVKAKNLHGSLMNYEIYKKVCVQRSEK